MRLSLTTPETAPVLRSKSIRFGAVALPAAIVTGCLFAAMQNLIETEDFIPADVPTYEVIAFMPVGKPKPPRMPDQIIDRPEPLESPPLPPPLAKSVDAASVPDAGYTGAAPANYGEVDLGQLKPVRAGSVIVRDLTPIAPPVPVYPRRAEKLGLQGDCLVYMNVSRRGLPFQVRAECTDPVFESAARKAVQKVKFAPQIRDGLPITVTGVVYPLEFRMEP